MEPAIDATLQSQVRCSRGFFAIDDGTWGRQAVDTWDLRICGKPLITQFVEKMFCHVCI